MATLGQLIYTVPGTSRTAYLKWITTNHTNIKVVSTGTPKIAYDYTNSTSPKLYGINGTYGHIALSEVYMIAMNNANPGVTNALKVRDHGDYNVDKNATMICNTDYPLFTTAVPSTTKSKY